MTQSERIKKNYRELQADLKNYIDSRATAHNSRSIGKSRSYLKTVAIHAKLDNMYKAFNLLEEVDNGKGE